MTTQTETTNATPYELLGGEAAVRRLVHRFYELMHELPEAHQVRRLHPESLENSEQNLFEYLSGLNNISEVIPGIGSSLAG